MNSIYCYWPQSYKHFQLCGLFYKHTDKNKKPLFTEQTWYCEDLAEALLLAKEKKEHWERYRWGTLYRGEIRRWSPYLGSYQPYLIAYEFDEEAYPYFNWKTVYDESVDIEGIIQADQEQTFLHRYQRKLFYFNKKGKIEYPDLYDKTPKTYGGYSLSRFS